MGALRTLFAIAVVLATTVSAQAASNEAIKRNNFGGELVKQGRLEEAMAEFQIAVQADPGYAAARLNLAYTLDRLGRADEAITAYKQAIDLDPQNATALNNLGVLYSKKGKTDDAIQVLEQGLKIAPENAMLQKNLENAKAGKKFASERDSRIAEARKRAEAAPKDSRAAYELARVYASFDMLDDAFDWLGKALQLGFDDLRFVKQEDPVLVGLRKDPRFARLMEGR